jgi:hypothetical protein
MKVYEELVKTPELSNEKKRDLHMKFFKDAFSNMDYSNPKVYIYFLST